MVNEPDLGPGGATADPWSNRIPETDLGGPEYGVFLETFRHLQDAVAESDPPPAVWSEIEQIAREMAVRLRPWAAGEKEQPAGTRMDLPGRGHPFLLPFLPVESTDSVVRGRVKFSRNHLGGNGAAHGGALPLLFDEILGRLANAGDRPVARTAYLTVNYRQITPVGVEMSVEATFDKEEGRKRWVSGRLFQGESLVADAEGLFVQLRPGQP